MRRVPEPELMLDTAQAKAYAEADFQAPHDHFVELLRARLGDFGPAGRALDLGCGPGDITLRVARSLPRWTITGIDASPAMLSIAEQAIVNSGLSDRITTLALHLPMAPTLEPFDLIYCNSLLHHLLSPHSLWQALRSWGRPGTHIFVMDLARPKDKSEAHMLLNKHAAHECDILRSDFFNSLLAAYTQKEIRAQLDDNALGGLQTELVSDRHWITWGRL